MTTSPLTPAAPADTRGPSATPPDGPVRRVGHPLAVRRLTVTRVEDLTPRLRRVTLTGPDLAGFTALGPADHVKVFFPVPLATVDPTASVADVAARAEALPLPVVENGQWLNRDEPALTYRDYTVRTFDPAVGLVLDMVVHEHGPAGRWAARATVGETLGVLGPRGSALPPTDRDLYLLAADETGLPALLNWLDHLPAGPRVHALVEVQGPQDEIPLPTRPGTVITWLHRGAAEPGTTTLLADAVAQEALDAPSVWAWAGAETSAVRRIRRDLHARGLGRESVGMTGYWRRGVANFDHHSPDA